MASHNVKYTSLLNERNVNQERKRPLAYSPGGNTTLSPYGSTHQHSLSSASNNWVMRNNTAHTYRGLPGNGEKSKSKFQKKGLNRSVDAKNVHQNTNSDNIMRTSYVDFHGQDLADVQPLDLSVRRPDNSNCLHYVPDEMEINVPSTIGPLEYEPVDLSMKTQKPQVETVSRPMLAEMPPTNLCGKRFSRSAISSHANNRQLKIPTINGPSASKMRRKSTKSLSPTGYKLAILVDENGEEIYRMGHRQNVNGCNNETAKRNSADENEQGEVNDNKLFEAPKMFKSLLTGALLNQHDMKKRPTNSNNCVNQRMSTHCENLSPTGLMMQDFSKHPLTSTVMPYQRDSKTVPVDITPSTDDIKNELTCDKNMPDVCAKNNFSNHQNDSETKLVPQKENNPCDSNSCRNSDDSRDSLSDGPIVTRAPCIKTSRAYKLVELGTGTGINSQKASSDCLIGDATSLASDQCDSAIIKNAKYESPKSSFEMQHIITNSSHGYENAMQETCGLANRNGKEALIDIQHGEVDSKNNLCMSENSGFDIPFDNSKSNHSNFKEAKIKSAIPALQTENGRVNNVSTDVCSDTPKISGNMNSKLYSLLIGHPSKNEEGESGGIKTEKVTPQSKEEDFSGTRQSFDVTNNIKLNTLKTVSNGNVKSPSMLVNDQTNEPCGDSKTYINHDHEVCAQTPQNQTCLRSLLSGKLVYQDKQDVQDGIVIITRGTNRSNKSIDVVVDCSLSINKTSKKSVSPVVLHHKPISKLKPKKKKKLEQICQNLWQKNASKDIAH